MSLSPAGRALLAGALLIAAYALVRYWRSLAGRPGRIRSTLVGLRAVTLALVACALAGVAVQYHTAARARVLLSTARGGSELAGADRLAAQLRDALVRTGFEVVSRDDGGGEEERGEGGEVVATALLTDGAMSAAAARQAVESLNAREGGVPVYVIADAMERAGPGVMLEEVTTAGRAVRGVPINVRCTVHARGMSGRESLLTISDGAKVQASARLKWTGDDERQALTLAVVPKVAGWIDYTAKVEAAGSADAQTQLARSFSLDVEERRWRVLFFESEPTWEAKFIRRALDESDLFAVDYFAQVSRNVSAGVSTDAGEQAPDAQGSARNDAGKNLKAASTPEAKLHATLSAPASLNAYDCVIVGATANSFLSSAEVGHLRDWVERRGGGLVVLGGNSFNGSIAAPGGKLYPLLPAEAITPGAGGQSQTLSQGRPLEAEKMKGSVALTPTAAGAGGALGGYLKASEEAVAKQALLAGQGFRLGALRPGASVLAVDDQPVAVETSEAGAPLVAAMRYGAGRTLLFAPADSWRIRTSASVEEGAAFDALWQGIVLWTSEGALPPVEIVLSEESPGEGSVLRAELRVRDRSFAPVKIERLKARLQPLTESADDASRVATGPTEVAFAPDAMDASIWRAQIPLRASGRFALEAEFIARGQSGSVEKRFTVVAGSMFETGAAFDTLRRVSRETGGDLLTPAGIDAFARRLASAATSTETISRTWELRAWWPLAFIIPLLLSAEWFARRWWHVD